MKNKISAFLCLSIILNSTSIPLFGMEEMSPVQEKAAIVHRGNIGTAEWTIDANGTLKIGAGEFINKTTDYNWPWGDYLSTEVTHVDGTAKFKVIGSLDHAFHPGLDKDGNVKANKIITMDLSGWDTSSVTNMGWTFLYCRSLVSLNIRGWDTSSVETMISMFFDCRSLASLDVSEWNTSSVEDMTAQFCCCRSLRSLDLTNWNTSAVEGMSSMFSQCNSLESLNLSNWDVSSVDDMEDMFYNCGRLKSLNLSGWNPSSLRHKSTMFDNCLALSNIKYSESCKMVLASLPVQTGWFQDGKGPYSIKELPKIPNGKTAQLSRNDYSSTGRVIMYRLYNPNSGEHFYTSSIEEKNYLVSVGWKDEGTGWLSPERSSRPVYRLYNANAGDHHYTIDENERKTLIGYGWKDEGIGWFSADTTGLPIYRQYNPNAKTGSHNYTTNKKENDGLVKLGWKAEGIGWYGIR